jgi:2-amino-4-hydroxy-6-hydroxymethyldihydropteridine diphosphokinase
MHIVYLLLGGNVGDRLAYLSEAKKNIGDLIGKCIKKSSLYQTQAWGFNHETHFLNQLLVVETELSPTELMQTILYIEMSLGRIRDEAEQWKERTIDIDILFFDDLVLKTDFIQIPHPRIRERRFVLIPLAEITPDLKHPVYNLTITELIDECNDKLSVSLYPASMNHEI